MKTFVYEKKGSKLVSVIKNVMTVICTNQSKDIQIITSDGSIHAFDCKIYKTTTYQN